MSTSRSEPKIVASGGSLRAAGELQRCDLVAFKNACQGLCDCEQQRIVMDLTHCRYMSSSFIGELADAVMRMKSSGKDVHVAVSAEIGKVLHMARLFHLFDYEIEASEIS